MTRNATTNESKAMTYNSAQQDTLRDLDIDAEANAAHAEYEAHEAAGRRMRAAGAAASTQGSIDAARLAYYAQRVEDDSAMRAEIIAAGEAHTIGRDFNRATEINYYNWNTLRIKIEDDARAYAEQADAELAMAKGD